MDMDKRYLSVIKACALSLLLVGVGGLSSCNSDDIKEDAMYTFTGETVASFCEKTPELSLFYKLMDECGETALLEVYGHFTCFAPTNDAINKYLAEKGLSWDGMSLEQKQKKELRAVFVSESDTALQALEIAGISYEGDIDLLHHDILPSFLSDHF